MKTFAFVISVAALLVSCNRVGPHIKQGAINLELGDFKRARVHFEAVLEKQPSNYSARLGLGKAMLQEFCAHPGDTALILDCLTQLEAARTLRPDKEVEKILSVVWFKRATLLVDHHDTIAAMAALSRSTGLDPKESKALNLAGILYFNRGDHGKALTLFRLVTANDSASVNGYFNAGMVYWADGNYSLAYDYWYKAACLAPDDKEIITWAAIAGQRTGTASFLPKEKDQSKNGPRTARP
jgi:tetratricopeptide (TPR) repeat protein